MAKSIRHMEWGVDGRCAGKRTYPTEAAARRVAEDQERKGAPPPSVYHCPSCAGFHLTSR
jgi:hypothetical protein